MQQQQQQEQIQQEKQKQKYCQKQEQVLGGEQKQIGEVINVTAYVR